jgi:hypothetical protein
MSALPNRCFPRQHATCPYRSRTDARPGVGVRPKTSDGVAVMTSTQLFDVPETVMHVSHAQSPRT